VGRRHWCGIFISIDEQFVITQRCQLKIKYLIKVLLGGQKGQPGLHAPPRNARKVSHPSKPDSILSEQQLLVAFVRVQDRHLFVCKKQICKFKPPKTYIICMSKHKCIFACIKNKLVKEYN